MLPESLGPVESPDSFLPQRINKSELDEQTLSIYKAKSGESFQKNSLVKNKIMPRLVVAEGIDIKANTLNNRDQRLRAEHGMFNAGFHVTRMVKGVKEVPKQVAKSAKKHSAEQWLHVRSTTSVCNDSANEFP